MSTDSNTPSRSLPGWLAPLLVLAVALLVLVPTTGDIGLTWDEPSYRYSQELSQEWWGKLIHARSAEDLTRLFDPATLLFFWPYGRFGINFHPPLAGQLNLLTYELFGNFMKDIPARRMASVIEFAFTIMILYQFLAKRYDKWVGAVAAGALLLMPRLYGDAHIAGTDTPGLLIWALAALAFWKGLHEPNARAWRVWVGVLVGLAFVQKMATVMVVVPFMIWLIGGHLIPQVLTKKNRAAWIDGLLTTTLMLIPLGLAFAEILRVNAQFVQQLRDTGTPFNLISVARMNLFTQHPETYLPGAILAVPLLVWITRRLLALFLPRSSVWGVERPALETWTSMLAFGPIVSWLGNPEWWRETIPRLAHYYALNSDRRGALPDIRILYFGQIYEYSLPWHNAWVWIAITVPVGILLAALVGFVLRIPTIRRDRIPVYFFLHLLIWPVLRMFNTPAHDGVRLFLPTFFFLAAFAGWGVIGMADLIARNDRARRIARSTLALLVLAPAAWALIAIHPYELSYYNEVIGGAKGAWKQGFELSYWYEAFDNKALADLNQLLPDGTLIDTLNEATQPPTFATLQDLGVIKSSLLPGAFNTNRFPARLIRKPGSGDELKRVDSAMWMLTHDSKATALTRIAFVMTPMYEVRPRQLDGLRVVAVFAPGTVARLWALQLIAEGAVDHAYREVPHAPKWVRSTLPFLARFWGDGLTRLRPLVVNERLIAWAKSDPATLRQAAKGLAQTYMPGAAVEPDADVERLRMFISHEPQSDRAGGLESLLHADPKALIEAVELLISRTDDIRKVLTRYSYTDPSEIGGPLDRDFPPRR